MTDRDYGQRGSSQGLSPSHSPAGGGAGGGGGTGGTGGGGQQQWRDLEGILFDAVKEYLRPSQLFAKGE